MKASDGSNSCLLLSFSLGRNKFINNKMITQQDNKKVYWDSIIVIGVAMIVTKMTFARVS